MSASLPRGEGGEFFLDILFHRMSVKGKFSSIHQPQIGYRGRDNKRSECKISPPRAH